MLLSVSRARIELSIFTPLVFQKEASELYSYLAVFSIAKNFVTFGANENYYIWSALASSILYVLVGKSPFLSFIQHPVFTSLQQLLQPDVDPKTDAGDIQQASAILSGKVDTSLQLLATTPSLHSLALEVVGNALVFQYTHKLVRVSSGEADEILAGD